MSRERVGWRPAKTSVVVGVKIKRHARKREKSSTKRELNGSLCARNGAVRGGQRREQRRRRDERRRRQRQRQKNNDDGEDEQRQRQISISQTLSHFNKLSHTPLDGARTRNKQRTHHSLLSITVGYAYCSLLGRLHLGADKSCFYICVRGHLRRAHQN